jgi:lipopolysaccharide transport system permease protein
MGFKTIKPKGSIYRFNIGELIEYKDLLFLFVKRDFISNFKQTILGPIWFFIQPILTSLMMMIVFTNIAKIGTDGIPPFLFYISGFTLWNYFSECLLKTSDTFIINQGIFGKVYFPRLIVPLSVIVSNLLKFGVQVILLILLYVYFYFNFADFHPVLSLLWLIPFLILLTAMLGLGFGILISSLTTKYRDLRFLIQFGVQLLMYASPIVYPLSIAPESYKQILLLNPMTSVIESFKYIIFGTGVFEINHLIYSSIFAIVLLFISVVAFNKVERSFVDIV